MRDAVIRKMWTTAVAAFGIFAASAAFAQDPSPVTVDDIVVVGVSERAISDYAAPLLEPARLGRFEGQIARWKTPVCLRVIGGTQTANDALQRKVAQTIRDLGVGLARPRCSPNAIIVLAAEAERFAAVFAERYRARFFREGRSEQAGFARPSQAVRWRHRTRTAGADGPPVDMSAEEVNGAPRIRGVNSRLTVATMETIDRALVVVDPQKLDLIASDALAEYLAFVILIDMPPGAGMEARAGMDAGVGTVGRSTILNLFEDPAARLTDWDRAFIAALYRSAPNQRFLDQAAEIERRMRSQLIVGAPARD